MFLNLYFLLLSRVLIFLVNFYIVKVYNIILFFNSYFFKAVLKKQL